MLARRARRRVARGRGRRPARAAGDGALALLAGRDGGRRVGGGDRAWARRARGARSAARVEPRSRRAAARGARGGPGRPARLPRRHRDGRRRRRPAASVSRRLARCPTRVACDVRNPLLGPRGAARRSGGRRAPTQPPGRRARAAARRAGRASAPFADLPGRRRRRWARRGSRRARRRARLGRRARARRARRSTSVLARRRRSWSPARARSTQTTLEGQGAGAVARQGCGDSGVRCVRLRRTVSDRG